MKKLLSIFALALVALASQALEVTLFDRTETSPYVPFRATYFDYSPYHHQVIYPEAEITALQGSTISSMTFYVANPDGSTMNGGKATVSIGTTDANYFSSYGPSFAEGEMTEVAEFSMTRGDSVIVVNFNQPWFYAGGNILLETQFTEDGTYVGGDTYFYGEETNAYFSAYGESTVSSLQFIPKTTFIYEPKTDYALVTPLALDFGQVQQGDEASKVITITNYGSNPFTPVIGTLAAPYSVEANPVELAHGESMQVTVKYVPGEIGQYPATLTIDCGAAGYYEVAITGETIAPVYEFTVAEGESYEGKLPFYGTYYDQVGTYGQMIYPADMLTMANGKKITKVTFHSRGELQFNGGKLQLSFKQVEEAAFETANPYDEMNVVATLVPTPGGNELTFVLSEPYQYNGGNLAIEARVIESSGWKSTNFYGAYQSDYVSMYHYTSDTDRSRFLPMATFTYAKDEEPQPAYDLGDVNHDHAVNVADVTDLIKYILTSGSEPEVFYPEEANVDGIEPINVADVTTLIQMILQN